MNAPQETGKQVGKQAKRPVKKQARKQAKRPVKKQARNQAGKQAGKTPDKKVQKAQKTKPRVTGKKPAAPPVATQSETPLILWSVDPEAAAPLIGALATVRSLEQLERLPAPGAVKPGPKAPEMLFLCRSPAETLCRMMAQGTPPGEALKLWMDQAGQVLAVNRRNRRRVHVVDLDQALGDPVASLTRFGVKSAAAIARQDSGDDPRYDSGEAADEVLRLLAQRCLSAGAQARALAGEIEAITAQGRRVTDDPDAAFRVYRERSWASQEADLLQAQTGMMLEEITLLQQQNHAVQDELDAQSEARLQLEQQSGQRLTQLSQGIESYQAQLADLQGEKARLNDKLAVKERAMDSAGARLRDLEAELEMLNARLAGAETDRGELQAQVGTGQGQREALQARVHQLEGSHSYRLTAPLRALRALISGGNKGNERGRG